MKSKGTIEQRINKIKRSINKFGSTKLKEDALKKLLEKQGEMKK